MCGTLSVWCMCVRVCVREGEAPSLISSRIVRRRISCPRQGAIPSAGGTAAYRRLRTPRSFSKGLRLSRVRARVTPGTMHGVGAWGPIPKTNPNPSGRCCGGEIEIQLLRTCTVNRGCSRLHCGAGGGDGGRRRCCEQDTFTIVWTIPAHPTNTDIHIRTIPLIPGAINILVPTKLPTL